MTSSQNQRRHRKVPGARMALGGFIMFGTRENRVILEKDRYVGSVHMTRLWMRFDNKTGLYRVVAVINNAQPRIAHTQSAEEAYKWLDRVGGVGAWL